jgi:hypothetical protein
MVTNVKNLAISSDSHKIRVYHSSTYDDSSLLELPETEDAGTMFLHNIGNY